MRTDEELWEVAEQFDALTRRTSDPTGKELMEVLGGLTKAEVWRLAELCRRAAAESDARARAYEMAARRSARTDRPG